MGKLRKTDHGRLEPLRRGPALDVRSRHLLILCNGTTPMAELRALFGEHVDALLDDLVARGLVERVEPRAGASLAPLEAASASTQPSFADTIDLMDAQPRAHALLENMFGSGGGDLGQAVQRARDPAAFEQALQGVHAAVSIYQGARRAARLLQQIRGVP